ncbi:hypothetical protein APHAL10511_003326 [Amanita phalloides]|nr:hypothetical protein APHAL10511_003326 [Amanita phalloides]
MVLRALFFGSLALGITFVTAVDFSKSNWIWKDHSEEVPPYELADFRYDFSPLLGMTAAAAEILIAADNNYTLWVNGQYIGQGNNWAQSQDYCVTLNPGHNLFAVETENQPPISPSALLAAIQITYTDGTKQTIVSDGSWRVNNVTAGFQYPAYDDSAWLYAIVLAGANGPPWHTPASPPPPSSLSLSNSFWIWTNEIVSPGGNAPVGHRAFRKEIHLPGGILTRGGTIIFDTDNGYMLYINGKTVGSAHDWTHAQRWTFTLDYPTDVIVIAADAYNDGGPAGMIAAVEFDVENCHCSSYSVYISDGSWKYNYTVPAGFEQLDYDDCGWLDAVVEGPYGMEPWGNVPTVDVLSTNLETVPGMTHEQTRLFYV